MIFIEREIVFKLYYTLLQIVKLSVRIHTLNLKTNFLYQRKNMISLKINASNIFIRKKITNVIF